METLDIYNNRMYAEHAKNKKMAKKAKVACPQCNTELEYADGNTLTSMPPKKRVRCPQCGFTGYKVL